MYKNQKFVIYVSRIVFLCNIFFCTLQALENLRQELANYNPVSQRKRTAIAGVVLLLLVITGVSAILTVGADGEFQRTNDDPFSSILEIRKAHIVFAICMSFTFFCLTLTLGVSLLWFIIEACFFLHRRRALNRSTAQVMREARQRSLLWGASVL